MTKDERIAVLSRIRTAAESALSAGIAAICVTVVRHSPPSRSHVYLAEHRGPLGYVMQTRQESADCWKVTARFQAARLIDFCSKTIDQILRSV